MKGTRDRISVKTNYLYINFYLFVVSYKNYILTLLMISFTIMFIYNYIIMVHYINFLCNNYNIMVITIMIYRPLYLFEIYYKKPKLINQNNTKAHQNKATAIRPP